MKQVILYRRGLTLIELMVALTCAMIAMFVLTPIMGVAHRENNLHNQVRSVKSAYVRARSKAMEFTQPVLFTVDTAANSILAVRDVTRTGNFSDDTNLELVVGEDVSTGTVSGYSGIYALSNHADAPALPHWSNIPDLGNCESFPSNAFIIHPDGRILDPDTLQTTSGTFFFATDPRSFIGALHITAMGEVKMAYIQNFEDSTGDPDEWQWKEF